MREKSGRQYSIKSYISLRVSPIFKFCVDIVRMLQ